MAGEVKKGGGEWEERRNHFGSNVYVKINSMDMDSDLVVPLVPTVIIKHPTIS